MGLRRRRGLRARRIGRARVRAARAVLVAGAEDAHQVVDERELLPHHRPVDEVLVADLAEEAAQALAALLRLARGGGVEEGAEGVDRDRAAVHAERGARGREQLRAVHLELAARVGLGLDHPDDLEHLLHIAGADRTALLEHELCRRFDLDYCEVAPDLGEEGIPLRALGLAGAAFLRREIEHSEGGLIGLAHGRTLAAAVQQMPRLDGARVRFVSLLGGLTRNYAANPHDVIHRMAEKTGAQAYVMPVPFLANSAEDREVLLAQRGVAEVFELASRAELKIAGIGTADVNAQLVSVGMVEKREIAEIKAAGGVGEMLGKFFDARGRVLETTLTARTLAVRLDASAPDRIIAIAGGPEKVEPIRAVLASGRLNGLITDEATARAIVSASAGART